MRTHITLISVLLILLVSGCSQKTNDVADVQAIKASVQDFVKGYQAKDADAVCSMMADDVIFAPGNVPPAVGKEAAQKLLKGVFDQLEQFDVAFDAKADDVQVRGDLATARGTYSRRLTHKSGTMASVSDSGNWTAVYQRQGDGSWKVVSDIGSSDQPLPGTTADGADEKALVLAEQNLAAAFAKADIPAMDRVLAKEWAWTNDGQLQTRAQVYGDLKNAYKLNSVVMKDMNPHVFGDFAIVTMIGELNGSYKGKDITGRAHSTDFFIKRNGIWQAVYSQNTTIKP